MQKSLTIANCRIVKQAHWGNLENMNQSISKCSPNHHLSLLSSGMSCFLGKWEGKYQRAVLRNQFKNVTGCWWDICLEIVEKATEETWTPHGLSVSPNSTSETFIRNINQVPKQFFLLTLRIYKHGFSCFGHKESQIPAAYNKSFSLSHMSVYQ